MSGSDDEIPVKKKHGGARPGSGRPKGSGVPKTQRVEEDLSMLELLREVALGRIEISMNQLKAAQTAIQYECSKAGEVGKKESAQAVAEAIAEQFPVSPVPLRAIR